EGDTVDVVVTLTNLGSQDITEPFNVNLAQPPTVVDTITVAGGLASGQTTTATLSWDTTNYPLGQHTVEASHDLPDEVAANDLGSSQVMVEAAITDLAITSVTPNPASVVAGGLVAVEVTLLNSGNQDIVAGTVVNLEVLSQEGTVSSPVTIGSLIPGATTTASFSWDTTNATPGGHTLRAWHNLTGDGVSGNNEDTAAVTVAAAVTDLAITSVTPSPASVVAGGVVSVAVTVANLGNQDVTGGIDVTLEDMAAPAPPIGVQTIAGGLAAGATVILSFNWDTTGLPTGDYTLRAWHNRSGDDLPGNDQNTGTVTVAAAVTDLAITSVTPSPATVFVGGLVAVDVTLLNVGNQDIAAGTAVNLEALSQEGTISSPVAIGGLTPGATTTASFSWDTTGATPGGHTLRAWHNLPGDGVPGNNEDTAAVTVAASLTDLAITSMVPNPVSASVGDTVTVDVTLVNQGNQNITDSVTVTLEDQAQPVPAIEVQTITNGLAVGATANLSFSWDTTGVLPGDYTLRVWHGLAGDAVAGNDEDTALVNISSPPVAPVIVSFQEGVNGYSGTVDTFIEQDDASNTHGNNSQFEWDDGNGTDEISLLRFEGIFGSGPGQIPQGATINWATLTYRVNNPGHAAAVNDALTTWDENATYNNFGSTPNDGVQPADLGAARGTASGSNGDQTLDVTGSLAPWSGDPASNLGWIMQPTNTDGVVVRSSEYTTISQRPLLTVEYVLIDNDLAITQVVPDTGNAVPGDIVTVDVTLANLGSQNFPGDITVSLEDIVQEGVMTAPVIVNGLASGATVTIPFSWDTTSATLGSHTLSARHDIQDEVGSNDLRTAQVVVEAPLTDLAIASVVPSPGSVFQGDSVSVMVTVANQGNQDVAGPVRVTLEDMVGEGSMNPTFIDLNGLNAGDSVTLPFSWNTTAAGFGEHTLLARHDRSPDDDMQNDAKTVSVTVADPASAPQTLSFQEGVDGYIGTLDTYLEEDRPTTARGSRSGIEWDDGSGTDETGLLRFDGIFGNGPGQISQGAIINSATLTYYVSNRGNAAAVNEVSVAWDEGTTYNTFGSAQGVQLEDYGDYLGDATADTTGLHTLDVTASLAAWSLDSTTNFGWLFRPTGTNGVVVSSSENSNLSRRPQLTVEFIAP
ncbi:MAG: CARDB domain-containing protein, partial [Dehalococcoidia bacterium]